MRAYFCAHDAAARFVKHAINCCSFVGLRYCRRSLSTARFPAHYKSAPRNPVSAVLASFSPPKSASTLEPALGGDVADAADDIDTVLDGNPFSDGESSDDMDGDGDTDPGTEALHESFAQYQQEAATGNANTPRTATKKLSLWEKMMQAKDKAIAGQSRTLAFDAGVRPLLDAHVLIVRTFFQRYSRVDRQTQRKK